MLFLLLKKKNLCKLIHIQKDKGVSFLLLQGNDILNNIHNIDMLHDSLFPAGLFRFQELKKVICLPVIFCQIALLL